MTHITSCTNFISIEHVASAVLVAFWLVFPFKERKNLIQFGKKTYNCIVFTNFQCTKLYLSLEFILKVFLKFRTFQPRYSYKIYPYKRKECKLTKKYIGYNDVLERIIIIKLYSLHSRALNWVSKVIRQLLWSWFWFYYGFRFQGWVV